MVHSPQAPLTLPSLVITQAEFNNLIERLVFQHGFWWREISQILMREFHKIVTERLDSCRSLHFNDFLRLLASTAGHGVGLHSQMREAFRQKRNSRFTKKAEEAFREVFLNDLHDRHGTEEMRCNPKKWKGCDWTRLHPYAQEVVLKFLTKLGIGYAKMSTLRTKEEVVKCSDGNEVPVQYAVEESVPPRTLVFVMHIVSHLTIIV